MKKARLIESVTACDPNMSSYPVQCLRQKGLATLRQFHQHLTRVFFVQKFVLSETLSREKLPKRLLYEKGVQKTLMKFTPLLF